jgi:hypothetical protein
VTLTFRPASTICSLVLALVAHQVWAQAPASVQVAKPAAPQASATGGPAWSQLTAQQRQALGPLEKDWTSIDAPRKAKWLEVSQRFGALPVEEQKRIQTRMAEWARLTPAERGRARLNFQESKQLSSEHKQARWEAYQALPDERRRELAARAKPREEHASGPVAVVSAASAATARKPGASGAQVKPVSPTVVQARPGATTTLMTRPVAPPPHQQPGQPTIAAKPGQVDRSTLLPKSGPQAAASGPVRQ